MTNEQVRVGRENDRRGPRHWDGAKLRRDELMATGDGRRARLARRRARQREGLAGHRGGAAARRCVGAGPRVGGRRRVSRTGDCYEEHADEHAAYGRRLAERLHERAKLRGVWSQTASGELVPDSERRGAGLSRG
jgi:hypothetical protein